MPEDPTQPNEPTAAPGPQAQPPPLQQPPPPMPTSSENTWPSAPPPPLAPFAYQLTGSGDGAPPRPRRRAPLLAAIAVLVVVAVGAGAFVLLGDDEADPDAALAAAQAAAEEATSFRFTLDAEDTYFSGDDRAGSRTTDTYTAEGAWAEGRWQMVTHDGYGVSESVFDDEASYDRWAENDEDLPNEQWERWEMPEISREEELEYMEDMSDDDFFDDDMIDGGWADSMAVSFAASLYIGGDSGALWMGTSDVAVSEDAISSIGAYSEGGAGSGFVGDPAGFLAAIQQISEPTLERDTADGVTLGATLQVEDDIVEAYGAPLPAGTVELDLDANDVPVALRLDVAQGESRYHVAVSLTDWNGDVQIDVPDDEDIDETPWIEEEAIREAAGEVALYVPTALADWEITYLEPDAASFIYEEGADCTVVEIDWDQALPDEASDEDWENADYIWLFQYTAACAMEQDDTPFTPGGPGGLPSREAANGYVEVLIGDTVIQIDASLDTAGLDPILASLVPADVEALITEMADGYSGF